MRGWAWIFEGRGEEGPRTDWLWHSSLAHSQRVRMIWVAVGPKMEANFEGICVGSKSGLSNISAILPWTFFPASDWCEPCTSAAIDGDVVIIVDFVHCRGGSFAQEYMLMVPSQPAPDPKANFPQWSILLPELSPNVSQVCWKTPRSTPLSDSDEWIESLAVLIFTVVLTVVLFKISVWIEGFRSYFSACRCDMCGTKTLFPHHYCHSERSYLYSHFLLCGKRVRYNNNSCCLREILHDFKFSEVDSVLSILLLWSEREADASMFAINPIFQASTQFHTAVGDIPERICSSRKVEYAKNDKNRANFCGLRASACRMLQFPWCMPWANVLHAPQHSVFIWVQEREATNDLPGSAACRGTPPCVVICLRKEHHDVMRARTILYSQGKFKVSHVLSWCGATNHHSSIIILTITRFVTICVTINRLVSAESRAAEIDLTWHRGSWMSQSLQATIMSSITIAILHSHPHRHQHRPPYHRHHHHCPHQWRHHCHYSSLWPAVSLSWLDLSLLSLSSSAGSRWNKIPEIYKRTESCHVAPKSTDEENSEERDCSFSNCFIMIQYIVNVLANGIHSCKTSCLFSKTRWTRPSSLVKWSYRSFSHLLSDVSPWTSVLSVLSFVLFRSRMVKSSKLERASYISFWRVKWKSGRPDILQNYLSKYIWTSTPCSDHADQEGNFIMLLQQGETCHPK